MRVVFSLVVGFVFVFLVSGQAQAQGVQDFVIESFRVQYELTNDDPQGLLQTTETIDVNFSGENRGILRAIPAVYDDTETAPRVISVSRDGKKEPYITYEENDNLVVRIGDVNTYHTGQHRYVIEYAVENVIRFYDTHDELYWDVNGDGWLQTFETVHATLRYNNAPRSTDSEYSPECFTGMLGSEESACEISQATNELRVNTTEPLNANETLTFIQAFEKGYFTPMSFFEKHWRLFASLPVVGLQGSIAWFAYKKWRRLGKDYKGRGVVAPYFGRPKNVSVMQASYVAANKLEPKHLSANVIDLAIRGYVKITEKKEGRKTKHELTLIKMPDSHVGADEKKLLEELIGKKVGKSVAVEDKKNKLYKTFGSLKKLIDEKVTKKGYYELSPKAAASRLAWHTVLGVIGVIIGFIFAEFSSGLTVVAGIVFFVLILVLSGLMTKRSRAGNLLVEHMEGLKVYLSRAESERIKMQDAVAAPLSPSSGEPKRDVKFFEKLLPFAVAMGVEKTWAEAFSDIYTQAPNWYEGNWKTFNTVALANGLAATTTATSTSFSAPSSSGSSGFSSGGGFSGGGGGGGGGGGW